MPYNTLRQACPNRTVYFCVVEERELAKQMAAQAALYRVILPTALTAHWMNCPDQTLQ